MRDGAEASFSDKVSTTSILNSENRLKKSSFSVGN